MMRAVLFDLDGTIVDSRREILDALTRACANAGLEGVRPRLSDIGLAVKDIVRNCAPGVTDADLAAAEREFRREYDDRRHELTTLYPGIVEVLRTLAEGEHIVGLATMKPKKPTASIIETFGLKPWLREVRCSDSWEGPRCTKAGLLERMIVELGCGRAETVYVGDHPDDMAAARKSGIKSIAALYGYGDPDAMRAASPDASVARPSEIPAALQRL